MNLGPNLTHKCPFPCVDLGPNLTRVPLPVGESGPQSNTQVTLPVGGSGPQSNTRVPLPVGASGPQSNTSAPSHGGDLDPNLTHGSSLRPEVHVPTGMLSGSAVLAQITVVTNRQTDRPHYTGFNRPYLTLCTAMWPNNCSIHRQHFTPVSTHQCHQHLHSISITAKKYSK